MDHQTELKFSLGVKHQIFNNELRKRREAMGLSQYKLGQLCGLGEQTIGHFETFRSYPQDHQAKKIAEILDVSVDILFPKWLELFKPKRTSITTEHLVTENILGNPEVLQLTSPDTDLYDTFDRALLREELDKQIETLSTREKRIIEERFGLKDNDPKTLEEVSKIFGVSRDRIRQIQDKALRKLRHYSRGRKLRSFLSNPHLNLECPDGHITSIPARSYREEITYICESWIHNRTEEERSHYEHSKCHKCGMEAIRVV